ncbi:PRC and DUF2382 domain-containing protein [Pseudonocardia kujensis]|uniref:DUF2382 domain-containing protein n=1 Tax=Pseudonocardia kujensis TaxID=1128675 RepID=UPI001E399C25|nr:PRC and DUF2382 domain-containing protein [Pseudonocardia kujensis]MCE0763140.1 PRC and DUF2382 domain-containing protein [Pseudonocardia kujensis]
MITQEMTRELIGRPAYDARGEKVGKIGQVYVDDRNGTPAWATVNTGLFGMRESFVPLRGADLKDGGVALPVQKSQVKDAPQVADDHSHLDPHEEQELLRHYDAGSGGVAGDGRAANTGPADRSRQATDEHRHHDDAAVTRSEERLRVSTESEETGRVRLRKYVVTEEQNVTVPVQHEEVRLEREPVRDGAGSGRASIGEDEQEITLHAERPVVDKKTEAVERVRLGKETVTEDEKVSDTVRKERVEVDDPHGQVRDRRS